MPYMCPFPSSSSSSDSGNGDSHGDRDVNRFNLQYTAASKTWSKEWAAEYDDVWHGAQVRWTCRGVKPVIKMGKLFYKEMWQWRYLD